jgi:tetratricopeptide (TPR) repeat protein
MAASVPQPDFSRQLRNPQLMEAALALAEDRLHDAEPLLKAHLTRDPFDVAAIRMLAELAGRIGRFADAEKLLTRAVELVPNWVPARSNLAILQYRQNRPVEALATLDALAELDPDGGGSANLRAAALGRIGDYHEALALYEQVLARNAAQPKVWMSYGHILKTVGKQADSVAAYRQALDLAPGFGEVWWSLANLKTVRFSDADLAVMDAALARDDLSHEDRFHLHFALGKARDERSEHDAAFAHYETGNRMRGEELGYDPADTTRMVETASTLFTPQFFAARQDWGCDAPDPVFILGMPRAGSTLIEQILSSHSQVEGTMELPDLPALFKTMGGPGQWAERVAALTADETRALGEAYLQRTRVQRKTDKPFFIDKLPNNWLHTGFIRLILPKARIINARRHPLDCCFSNFRQHFARGQAFSYALDWMGAYYRDYVRLMAHMDSAQPGAVVRVIHEDLLDDPEGGIRALLNALGLPFEEACLRFHENERAVRTASSEQVRRPINRDGAGAWKPYERWLGPLKDALGDVVEYK